MLDHPEFGIEELRLVTDLLHLQKLDIREIRLEASDLIYLGKLSELRYLTLEIDNLTDDHVVYLQRLGQLEALCLKKGAISDTALETLQRVLSNCDVQFW